VHISDAKPGREFEMIGTITSILGIILTCLNIVFYYFTFVDHKNNWIGAELKRRETEIQIALTEPRFAVAYYGIRPENSINGLLGTGASEPNHPIVNAKLVSPGYTVCSHDVSKKDILDSPHLSENVRSNLGDDPNENINIRGNCWYLFIKLISGRPINNAKLHFLRFDSSSTAMISDYWMLQHNVGNPDIGAEIKGRGTKDIKEIGNIEVNNSFVVAIAFEIHCDDGRCWFMHGDAGVPMAITYTDPANGREVAVDIRSMLNSTLRNDVSIDERG
jgi:hypothetical protein